MERAIAKENSGFPTAFGFGMMTKTNKKKLNKKSRKKKKKLRECVSAN